MARLVNPFATIHIKKQKTKKIPKLMHMINKATESGLEILDFSIMLSHDILPSIKPLFALLGTVR